MIETVAGPIAPEALGVTFPHEHVVCGAPTFLRGFGERFLARERIVDGAAAQLRASGAKTLVDGTPFSLGRDVALLREVSERSGVNIVASTGFYHLPEFGWNEVPAELQAEYFIEECREGIEGTGIRPGFLKCALEEGSDPRPVEVMGRVQRATGLPLFAHANARTRSGLALVDLLERGGVDPERVVVGHVGDAGETAYAEALLRRGCFVCVDRLKGEADTRDKARMVAELAGKGFLHRCTVSSDAICLRMSANRRQTGARRAPPAERRMENVMNVLVPELRRLGFGQAELDRLLIANPARVLRPSREGEENRCRAR